MAALAAAPLVPTAAARLIAASIGRVAPATGHAICSPSGCALIAVLYAAATVVGAAKPANSDARQAPTAGV